MFLLKGSGEEEQGRRIHGLSRNDGELARVRINFVSWRRVAGPEWKLRGQD